MSSFQDLYEHAAADRGRAMQFLAIQEIRRRAVQELTDAKVYADPENDGSMTDEDLANRRAEAAYIYGIRSIVQMVKLPEQDGDEVYAMEVRDTSSKAYCLALCIQTKMEELRATGSEKNSANGTPRFHVVISNDLPDENVDGIQEALEVLKVAYPAWKITMEVRSEEVQARAALAENIRNIMQKVQNEQNEDNVKELAAALVATPLVFPAQRPEGAKPAQSGEEEHLQFGKARSQDGKSYFLAFTDRPNLLKWRQFGSVELFLKDYAPLILQSKDDGLILDPYVGANMCITKEMLQSLQVQYEMVNNLMQVAADIENGTFEMPEQPKAYEPKKPKVNEWWKKNK